MVLPFGGQPMRKFFLSVFAIFMACFAILTAFSPVVGAQATTAEEITWNGESLVYKGNQYYPNANVTLSGVPAGSKVYIHAEPPDPNGGSGPRKAHVIYFAPGSDPGKATSASYRTYDITATNTYDNPSGETSVTVKPPSSSNPGVTSCDSTFTMGIGWIVCPMTNFLANAMDWLFDILSGFLTVRPAQTNQENALYRAWSFMRNFANVSFVIGFLIIIYSQISNIGLSNYQIKKMLPRIIAAAILVNVSYWICSVAIDISNILGYSIQDIFISMRNSLIGTEGNSWDVVSWKSIGGFILSGGAAALGIGIATHAALGMAGGALYLLLPILVGVLMAALIALLVLAARQAIITILVILSPLAFVAFLLPNTEKYFEKWRDLLITMLIMFPLFSIIFGGSQLAGIVIIQNADSINLIILGMAVQIAPVVITPLLVRFSGSLLGKIAGMVNNPNKGVIDRTRNWSKERAEQHKARVLANPANRRRDGLARVAQNMDRKRRKREGWHKVNQEAGDARWANTREYSDIQQGSMRAALAKEVGESAAQVRFEGSKYTNAAMQQLDIDARTNKLKLDVSKARVEANWEELKGGSARNIITPAGLAGSGLASFIHNRDAMTNAISNDAIEASVEARRAHSAKHEQQQRFAKALDTDVTLRQRAGGIDPSGAIKAQATAVSEILKANDADVEAGVKLLDYQALRGNTTLKSLSDTIVKDLIAHGPGTRSTGEIEAALEAQAKEGQMVLFEKARMSNQVDQDMISRVIARNVSTFKSKGGFHLQADPGLANVSINVMNAARAGSLGDTPAENMKDLKFGWIAEIATNISSVIRDGDPADLDKAYNNVYEALDNDRIRATIGDRINEVQAIELALRNSGYTVKPKTL